MKHIVMVSYDINNQYALNPISTFKLSDGEIIHSEIRESKELGLRLLKSTWREYFPFGYLGNSMFSIFP